MNLTSTLRAEIQNISMDPTLKIRTSRTESVIAQLQMLQRICHADPDLAYPDAERVELQAWLGRIMRKIETGKESTNE